MVSDFLEQGEDSAVSWLSGTAIDGTTREGLHGGLLLLAGAVKCDALGVFPVCFLPGLQLWEGEKKRSAEHGS